MPVVDLTVDRNLLCPNFDGYKLSFDAVPVLRQGFDVNPLKLEPHADQYSLLHAELFARHNLLVSDPWSRYNCYFINVRHEVVLCSYNEQQGVARSQRIVYSTQSEDRGDGYRHQVGDYNYTLRFISEKYCVLCDGIVELCLLDTGDRERATPWKLLTRTQLLPEFDERGFVLYDARLDIVQEHKQISLVAGHVTRQRGVHVMQLTWSRWSLNEEKWTYQVLQQLETRGSIYYCAFEPRAESLVVCSNGELQTPQQAEEAAVLAAEEETKRREQLKDASARKSWVQTDDEVLVRLPVPAGITRNDVNVHCAQGQLRVECQGQTLLEGELHASVDTDLTNWTQEQSRGELHLTLYKLTQGQKWVTLLSNEQVEEEGRDAQEEEEQLPIPNLEEPIEDCDLPVNANSEDIKMVRFNLAESGITHTIFLGSTPPLFVSSLRPGYPVAFATRQGVDASLWLQLHQPTRPQEWSVRHEGNLHAFGYVQASKQLRKFMDCCPDLEYAVITESYRHVFIYKSRYDSAGGLRNRNGPQVVIGKQHLVTLDEDVGEVLGMVTAPNVIMLLTEHAVLYIQV